MPASAQNQVVELILRSTGYQAAETPSGRRYEFQKHDKYDYRIKFSDIMGASPELAKLLNDNKK
jgi:hypothetical protein